jgi:hypothetical protein
MSDKNQNRAARESSNFEISGKEQELPHKDARQAQEVGKWANG